MLRTVTIGHLINLVLAWLDNKLADLRSVLAHAFQRLRPVTKRRSLTLYCSFCGKSQHEVEKLVAGPRVFIRDGFTDLCHEIVHRE